jgi:LPXTG-site transpeptidase (sortase) family protein
MLKRKENKTKIRISKKSQLIVGSLLIIIGISLVGGKLYYNYYFDHKDDDKIQEFYEEQEKIEDIDTTNNEDTQVQEQNEVKAVSNTNYIAVIKIPKIGLERGLYSKDSSYNNVNKNIQILNESSYPDVDGGNFILASHSGNSRISYFRKLDKLETNDEISIFYNGSEYKYKVVNIYDIEKTGSANIVRNASKTTLTLITCRHNTNKQIIVICELVEKI